METKKKNYYAVIPANVRYDKRLKPNAKLLYGEITALCNEKGYCWASNSYFAELYEVKRETISRYISQLAEYKYIYVKMNINIKTKRTSSRIIQLNPYPIDEKVKGGIDEKVKGGIDEKVKVNNTLINTTSININEEEITKTANNADRIISSFSPLSSDSSLDRNPVAIATSQSPLTLGEPKVNSKRKTDKSVLGEPANAEGVVKQSNTNTNNKNKKTHSPQATTLSNRGFRFVNIVEHNATVSELVTNINKLKIKFDGTYLLENQSFKYLSKILKTGMFEKPVGIAPTVLAKKVVSNIRYKIEDLGKTFPSVKSWVTQFSKSDYAYLLSLYEEGGIMTFKGVQRLTKDIISVFLVCGVGEQSFTPEMFFRLKKDNLINDLRVTKTQLPLILELILKGQETFKNKYFKNELTEDVRPYYTL
jgi:hypothetical protein